MKRTVVSSLFWASLVLIFAGTLARSTISANLHRLEAIHDLSLCAPQLFLSDVAYDLWRGKTNLQLAQVDVCDALLTNSATPTDVQIIVMWAMGITTNKIELVSIRPSSRRLAFEFRQNLENKTVSQQQETQIALLAASAARYAWLEGDLSFARELSSAALGDQDNERIAANLIDGLQPVSMLSLDTFFQIRKMIATKLPNYARNYTTWYATAAQMSAWDAAEEACFLLRSSRAAQEAASLAATCSARIVYLRGDAEEAYQQLEKVISLRPSDPIVLEWYGMSALKTQRYREAESIFTEALSLQPSQDALLNLYWSLGDSQRLQNKTEAAIASYRHALQFDLDARYQKELELLIKSIQDQD